MNGRLKLLGLASMSILSLSACAPAAAPPPTAPPAKPTEAPKPAAAAAPTAAVAAPTAAPAPPAAQAAAAAPKADPKAIEEFYKGKTVRVIVATTAGSVFDAWGRLVARHMPKHLPGNPNMIVENMPGAGHLIGANHLYNVAPKDGTAIGTFVETQVTNQLVGGKGIEFDMAKFNWIGSVQASNVTCVARSDTSNKITDLSALIGPSSKEVVFGTTGPGTNSYDFPSLMKQVLGANLRLVSGYPGNQEVRKAIEGGEVEAYCATWDAVGRGLEPWKQAGAPPYVILVQEGEQRHLELQDVPLMRELAKTEDDKLMFKVLSGPSSFTRPFAAPPGTPPERVEALRQAFMDVFEDPELIDEAKKASLDFEPKSGAQVQAGMQEVLNTPPAAAERFTKLMTP
jgi:tripartite-type tricarboxylate transporter receptor subunit TctC